MAGREKVLKYLTPDIPADELDRFKRSFCIPNSPKWLGNFMGAIEPLTREENWELDGVVTPSEAATVFQQIFSDAFYATGECDDMVCCPLRYGANGVLQQQNPVTGEWDDIENPPLPARTPVEGQDDLCLAAANATAVIAQLWLEVDRQFFSGASPYIALAAVISLLAILIFYPPAFFAVLTFFLEFAGLWSEISGDDFDTDQQEQLQCILFCAASQDENGVVTFNFAEVNEKVDELWEPVIDFNIFMMVHYMLGIMGEDGLNRAGATTGVSEADCDECTECDWCVRFDFTETDGGFNAYVASGTWGEWVAGVGWRSTFVVANNTQSLAIEKAFADCEVRFLEFTATWVAPGSGATTALAIKKDGSTVASGSSGISSAGTYPTTYDGAYVEADYVLLNPAIGSTTGGLITMTSAEMRGRGAKPTGGVDC